MTRYIVKRLLAMVPVLFLVSLIVFAVIHLIPGDPAVIMLGEEATPQSIAALRKDWHLNDPLPVQYVSWLSHVLRGDLGNSLQNHQPVTEAIAERLPVTFEVTLFSIVIALIIAIPTGVLSATRRNSSADLASTTVALFGVSMPSFFLAILLIFLFSLKLRWLPPIGFTPITENPLANLRGMILPSVTLGTAAAAIIARLTRSSLLEVLDQDYIRTARAKGLGERLVVYGHALKNAMIPVLTVIGLQIGILLGGAVITETIFVLPGVGRLVVTSIFSRDFPMVQGVVLFLSVTYLFVNLAVDILYSLLDPRIRYG